MQTSSIDFWTNKFPSMGTLLKPDHSKKQELLKTGIPIIDDVLGGIINTDIVVIGSYTGRGKTQLATMIASSVAARGDECAMFSLESYDGEIEDRLVFSEVSKAFYSKYSADYLSFKEWVTGNCDDETYSMERAAVLGISDKVKENLRIRYRSDSGYNVSDFVKEIDALCAEKRVRLIVIDHLHYFDLPEANSENRAITAVMKKLRETGQRLKVPIVLFAHLRKKDKSSEMLVPDENEFHGSSEIVKNATAIITFASTEIRDADKRLIPTYFRFSKLRFDEGGKKRYLYCCTFNIQTGGYEKEYRIYRPKNYWTDKEPVCGADVPKWAKHARRIL